MNGRTTFQRVATADEVVDFGVPSGKAPGVKLDFKKSGKNMIMIRAAAQKMLSMK